MAARIWGDPTSNKRVLLIHGLSSSSPNWNRVAKDFASRGYFVTAPDLLGHGLARRGSVYTVAALAEELQPFLKTRGEDDHPYDVVVGHSLGGVIVSAFLPLLKSTRPVRVVLADPPLEMVTRDDCPKISWIIDSVRNPESPEALAERLHIPKEDATLISSSLHLCDVTAVEAIRDQNLPWSFSHHLSSVPDNVSVTVLSADPSKGALFKEECLKDYPRVRTRIVWGASHLIHLERPDIVVEAALE